VEILAVLYEDSGMIIERPRAPHPSFGHLLPLEKVKVERFSRTTRSSHIDG